MGRRKFHKAVPAAAPVPAAPPLPHPGDALPAGASVRLGTNRFWHLAERGNEGLNDLTFAPDGRTLAALGYQDGCISLWEVPSGALIRKWEADDADRCGELAFSPDGRLLGVGSNDGVRIWDAHTGRLVRKLTKNWADAHGVAFSPDGRLLAGAMALHGTVDVWDVVTGKRAARFEPEPHPVVPADSPHKGEWFECVAFSPDGTLVAAGSTFQVYHDVRGAEATALQKRLIAKQGHTTRCGWGRKTYVVEDRGRVWCWELATGRLVAKLEGHELPVERVRFTPDGRLVSCGSDGAVWAWDVRAGRRVAELAESLHHSYAAAAAFTADGRHVLLSRPGYLGLIDLAEGREVGSFTVGPDRGGWQDLAVSPDARWVATAVQGRIALWDAAAGADVSPPDRHTAWVGEVQFTADGGRVVTATANEAVLWDAATGRRLAEVKVEVGDRLMAPPLALSPDGLRAASVLCRWPSRARMVDHLATWDWETGTVRAWDKVGVTAVAWPPPGDALVVGTAKGKVFSLDLATGRRHRLLDGVPGGAEDLAVSGDGRLVAALGKEGGSVDVCERSPGARPHRLAVAKLPAPPRYHPCQSGGFICLSPDGGRVAYCASRGHVCLGPADGPSLPHVFSAANLAGPGVVLLAAAFLPDGRLLVAGTAGTARRRADEGEDAPYTIFVWDADSGRELWASPPRRFMVSALAFSPDGRKLASGSYDATALLWELRPTNRHRPGRPSAV